MDIPLRDIVRNGTDGTARTRNEQVGADAVDGPAHRTLDAAERGGLLQPLVNGSNGDSMASSRAAGAQRNHGGGYTPPEMSSASRAKKELSQVVFWKVKLWMVVVFIFLLIAAVIFISLALCSAIHEDVDEKFDRASFTVPRHFNGSFRLPGQVFSEELLTISSNQSRALAAGLREKLADLYRSSPALGRYFSEAEIHSLRNGSVIAEYQLTFLMPAEQQQQQRLSSFTLSREMVFNVLRQFLYDQEASESGPMYIDPLSLNLF